MYSIGVFGASGYAGQELLLLLRHHPYFSVSAAISDSWAGTDVEGYNSLSYSRLDDVNFAAFDLVFLCTPHGASAQLAAKAIAAGAKVVDLSADLRLNTPDAYTKWYGDEHPAPHLLPAPYGLPELFGDELTGVDLIANPGCYPTSILLPLLPLTIADMVQPNMPIIADSKSGVSGAGHTPKPHTHFVEVFGDLKPYSIGRAHRHVGEIEQELQASMSSIGQLIFSPHLLPVDRGLLSTIYVPLTQSVSDAHHLLADTYANQPLVAVLPLGEITRLKHVVHTNKAIISISAAGDNMAVIISAIDNLRKGAASQAIQNANLMMNLPHTTGLLEVATHGVAHRY